MVLTGEQNKRDKIPIVFFRPLETIAGLVSRRAPGGEPL